jgi:hypothetical protein
MGFRWCAGDRRGLLHMSDGEKVSHLIYDFIELTSRNRKRQIRLQP